MSGDSNVKAALDSMAIRKVCVANLYLLKHGQNNEEEVGVKQDICIPIMLDGSGSYSMGAKCWGHHKLTEGIDPTIFFLVLCILLVEKSPTMGGYVCSVDPDEKPLLYAKIVRITAKRHFGKISAQEKGMFEAYVQSGFYVDRRFEHDVKYEEELLVWEKARKKKKGAKKQKKEEEEDESEEVEPKQKKQRTVTTYDSWRAKFGDLMAPQPRLAYFAATHIAGNKVNRDGEEEFAPLDEAQNIVKPKDKVEEDEVGKPVYVEFVGTTRMPKVSFSTSVIRNAANVVTGLLARFLIYDDKINVGSFFKRVLDNKEQRVECVKQGKKTPHEMFPNYSLKFASKTHPTSSHVTRESYLNACIGLRPEILENYGNRNTYNKMANYESNSAIYLSNIFTIDYALSVLKNGGGAGEWQAAGGIAYFNNETYKYQPEQVFWEHPTHVSLSEHMFPHHSSKEQFIARLRSEVDPAKFFEEEDAQDNAFKDVQSLLENNSLVLREALLKSKLINYDTNNEFLHKYEEMKVIYKKIRDYFPIDARDTLKEVQDLGENWREKASPELMLKVKEYELFSKVLQRAQEELKTQFCTLWNTEGNIDELSVSEPVKVMLKWYRQIHTEKLPNMTREYVCWDPEMDVFQNTMIQEIKWFKSFQLILQPKICLLAEGLFSAYDAELKELCFSMILGGRHDTGKTFMAIKTLIEYTCIPDTVFESSLSTKATDTTKRHRYDVIRAADECPNWMITQKEAEKNQEQVGKEKLKRTRGQLNLDSFVYITLPSGERVRWSENVTTDHKCASVEVTNCVFEGKDALSSRTYRITMTQSQLDATKMTGHVDPKIKADTSLNFQIKQYLSCCARKAAAVGMIVPQPEMTLAKHICARVLDYMKCKGYLNGENGPRSLEIVWPYLRQLIYKTAFRCYFDMPTGAGYKKKFDPALMQGIQPYLYVTISQIWWALTACASEWIDNNYSNVLKALCRVAKVDWSYDSTAYDIYQNDIDSTVPWRTHPNTHYVAESNRFEPGDAELIDLQYITVEGTEQSIAGRVAELTDPKMSAQQVVGIFEELEKKFVEIHRNGYAYQPKGKFAKWHKKIRVMDPHTSKQMETPEGYLVFAKNLGASCPPEYNKNNQDASLIERCDEDVPPIGPLTSMQVIDRSELLKYKKMHFNPAMILHYQQEIITEALVHATLCSSFGYTKMLQGIVDNEDTTLMSVAKIDEKLIAEFVRAEDESLSIKYVRGQPVLKLDDEFRPISRTEGIVLNYGAALDKEDAELIAAAPIAPVKDDSWKERYKTGTTAMSKIREVIYDCDAYSATLQHLACGRPLDEPILTPQKIKDDFEQHCIKSGAKLHQDWDYPFTDRAVRDRLARAHNSNQTLKTSSEASKTVYKYMRKASMVPRKRLERSAESTTSPPNEQSAFDALNNNLINKRRHV